MDNLHRSIGIVSHTFQLLIDMVSNSEKRQYEFSITSKQPKITYYHFEEYWPSSLASQDKIWKIHKNSASNLHILLTYNKAISGRQNSEIDLCITRHRVSWVSLLFRRFKA